MKLAVLNIVIFLSCALLLRAQNIDVPIETQVPILMKILPLERNLAKKVQTSKSLNVLVIYQNRFRTSLSSKNKFIEEMKKAKTDFVGNINFFEYDFVNSQDLSAFLKKNKIDLIVVTPLRAINLSEISDISQQNKIFTFSLVPDYVVIGLTLGFELKLDKPQIIVNLSSARQEGLDFSSHLLKLARIIE